MYASGGRATGHSGHPVRAAMVIVKAKTQTDIGGKTSTRDAVC